MQRLQLDDARGGGADLKRQDFDPLGRATGVAGLRRDNQDENAPRLGLRRKGVARP